MNTIIKTITKKDSSGLSFFKVEQLTHVDLGHLNFKEQRSYKGHEVYVYENTLLGNHHVKVEIIQMHLSKPIIKLVNFTEDVIKLREKVSHGKAGWTTLKQNLDSIIKREPWI